ncbi:MAG: FecR family protein [Bacteroidia bacterium]
MNQPLPDHEILRLWLEGKGQAPEGLDPELLRAVEEAGKLDVPSTSSTDAAWERFMQENHIETPVEAVTRPLWKRYWAVAAALALVVSLGVIFLEPNNPQPQQIALTTLTTTNAEHTSIDLPDGSSVMVNAASHIEFDKENWETNREVHLEGEAYFDVEKGSTFKVLTSMGDVEVLGTRFNVYARKDGFEVACLSGKVKVTPESGSSSTFSILSPQQIFRASTQSAGAVTELGDKQAASWRKGEFSFDNTPLIEVIAVMERQYNVQIELDGISERVFFGNFTNDDLDEAFRLVTGPLGLKYVKLGDSKYRISGTD